MYSVVRYIDNHIEEKLTLDGVATFAGYSKWRFCSLFKRFTGKSFIDYVNDKKMQYAVNDIIRGEKVTTVAFKYGFDSLGGFNKAFLKKFGCYPTQFKKQDDEFHVKYKEKKESMFKLSDRCAILKEQALKNVLELKVGFRTRYYMAKGEAKAEEGADNLERISVGLCSVIENMPCYIQDGELIVGVNYGYESRFNIKNVKDARKRLEDEGFTQEEIEGLDTLMEDVDYSA
jgi:AraC-like DNA-binding protein